MFAITEIDPTNSSFADLWSSVIDEQTQQCIHAHNYLSESRFIARVDVQESAAHLEVAASLTDGWDGYGASRIDSKIISNSKRILEIIAPLVGAPEIVPNTNGTISFELESPTGFAHIEIGKTKISFFAKSAEGDRFTFDGNLEEFDRSMALTLKGILTLDSSAEHVLTAVQYPNYVQLAPNY